jgi:hypothetical protein
VVAPPPRHGGRLGPVQALGRGHHPPIRAAIEVGRRAAVVWQTRTSVRLARAGTDGRFTAPQVLDRFPATIPCGLDVVYAGSDPIAAWSAPHGGHLVVRSGAQTVSDPNRDSCLTDLAAGPSGEAALIWSQGLQPEPSTLAAAVRDPGGTQFSAPESVTAGPRGDAFLAFGPTTGRIVAVWATFAQGPLMSAVRDPLTSR